MNPLRRSFARAAALIGDRRGGVAIEFILVAPLVFMLLAASVELGRFALLNQKIARAASAASDLVTRAAAVSEDDLVGAFDAASRTLSPFAMGARGGVAISAARGDRDGGASVLWRRAHGPSPPEGVGATGGPATLPNGMVLNRGEIVIVAEIAVGFEPLLGELLLSPQVIYSSAQHRPRFGGLERIQGSLFSPAIPDSERRGAGARSAYLALLRRG